MTTTAYCTVAASNYLPQVIALHESLSRHMPGNPLHVLVVDSEIHEVPLSRADLIVHAFEFVEPDEIERHNLAAIYDVVELSTALKPKYFEALLREYDRVIYLDPDMWLVSSIGELDGWLDRHRILLTPHFLEPIPPDGWVLTDGKLLPITEVHCLTVGIHNLGFCAVSREALPFLEWWDAHLRRECLAYPLLGMFVDQKWTDVGATLFSAHSLRHYGYNIGNWNLQERRFHRAEGELRMTASDEPVRLLHFSGFNPRNPHGISVRQNIDLGTTALAFPEFLEVSQEYAASVLSAEAGLPTSLPYGWARDSGGRLLSKRLRRTYRQGLLRGEMLPSPFRDDDLQAFRRWTIRAAPSAVAGASMDAAIAAKYAFPDLYRRFKGVGGGGAFSVLRQHLLEQGRIRR